MANSITIDLKDIRSVTDFQRNAKDHLTRLKKTKRPMVLTVNGTAAVVVQDALSYQKLVDHLDELKYERGFITAVNEGLKARDEGRVHPARTVLKYRGARRNEV